MKILWITDLMNTGYANASIPLVNYLLDNHENNYEIYICFINYMHSDIIGKENEIKKLYPKLKNYTLHPIEMELEYMIQKEALCNISYMSKRFFDYKSGITTIIDICKTFNPDVAFSINDNYILERHRNTIHLYNNFAKKNCRFIPYLPIDCMSIKKGFFDNLILNNSKSIITMTNFGKRELLSTNKQLHVYTLNHIIDSDKFFHINNLTKKQLREFIFPQELHDKFLILNSNKNQERKCLNKTLDYFHKLATINSTVILLLKTKANDILNNGYNLHDIISTFSTDIKNRIIIFNVNFDTYQLNILYNAIDLNINKSYGEGFGIIPFEVALTNTVNLVPENTSYPEFFPKECLVKCNHILKLEMNYLKNSSFCEDANEFNLSIIMQCLGYNMYSDLKKENISFEFHSSMDIVELDTIIINHNNVRFSMNDKKIYLTGTNIIINVLYIATNLLDCIQYIKENINRTMGSMFQIVATHGVNFQSIKYIYDEIYDNEYIKTFLKQFDVHVKDYKNSFVKIGLVDTDDMVSKTLDFITSKTLMDSVAYKCKHMVLDTLNANKIGSQLHDILSDLSTKKEDV